MVKNLNYIKNVSFLWISMVLKCIILCHFLLFKSGPYNNKIIEISTRIVQRLARDFFLFPPHKQL